MTVEEILVESIRKDSLGPRMKAYIASMPARDKQQASVMTNFIKREYGLDAVQRAAPLPGYDPYTYVSVGEEDIQFRSAQDDGIVLLEMQDYQDKWHIMVEVCRESVNKEGMLGILRGETSSHLGSRGQS